MKWRDGSRFDLSMDKEKGKVIGHCEYLFLHTITIGNSSHPHAQSRCSSLREF